VVKSWAGVKGAGEFPREKKISIERQKIEKTWEALGECGLKGKAESRKSRSAQGIVWGSRHAKKKARPKSFNRFQAGTPFITGRTT